MGAKPKVVASPAAEVQRMADNDITNFIREKFDEIAASGIKCNSEKATELSNPTQGLVDGGYERVWEGLFVNKGIEGIKFMFSKNGRSGSVWVGTSEKGDPKEAAKQ